MTYRGRVRGGVVVLEGPNDLVDGAEVEVALLSPQGKGVGEGLEKLAGKAEGLPPDLAQRHDHYRRERGS